MELWLRCKQASEAIGAFHWASDWCQYGAGLLLAPGEAVITSPAGAPGAESGVPAS